MVYDVWCQNGFVFDSHEGRFAKRDLFIKDGKIVEPVDKEIEAKTVIDATGKYVVPGLIDEHLHLDLNGSMIGANGDTLCIPNGITTACDGGTCGASNFSQFYNSNIIRYETHTYSYLNVSTFGNKSLCIHEEDHDPRDFREDLIEQKFRKYPGILRGLKVRMCKGTLGEYGMAPLHRALEISDYLQRQGYHCPLVVHYDNLPENVTVRALFDALRPGDIVAHVYQTKGETIFLPDGSIHPAVLRARERGVLMDDCHGRVHWSISQLKNAVKMNFLPDIISSDSVRISEYVKPGFSLLYAMSMLSAVGMQTEQILQCVTINPARALGIEDKAGDLKLGMPADVTILDIQNSEQELFDFWGDKIKARKLFVPLLTMVEGRVAYRQIFF